MGRRDLGQGTGRPGTSALQFPALLLDPSHDPTCQLQCSQERGQWKRSLRHTSHPGDGEILPSTPSPTPGQDTSRPAGSSGGRGSGWRMCGPHASAMR